MNFDSFKILQSDILRKNDPYISSLFYQLTNQYHLEHDLVTQEMAKNPTNYMEQRYKWHQLPIFDQMVPRPHKKIPYDGPLPNGETLEKMCFITEGDSHYFSLMVELVESIQATEFYKDIPFYIIDGGLTDENKEYFYKKLKVKNIRHVSECTQVPNDHPINQLVAARPFIDELFPGHQYYVYLDADTWVQDEKTIHKMLVQAETQGLSLWQNEGTTCGDYKLWYEEGKILEKEQVQEIADKPLLSANLFAINTEKGWFSEWKKLILEIFNKNKMQYGCDEASITYLAHTKGITEFLNAKDQHFMWFFIPPVYNDDAYTLYSTDFETPIGIIHITGGLCGFRSLYKKAHYYLPTQKFNSYPFAFDDRQKHWDISIPILKVLRVGEEIDLFAKEYFPNQTFISFHYRVYPWENKNKLKNELAELLPEFSEILRK